MGKDAESCDCVPWDGPERKSAAWTLTWTWNSPSLEEGSRAARTCGSASDGSHAFQMCPVHVSLTMQTTRTISSLASAAPRVLDAWHGALH